MNAVQRTIAAIFSTRPRLSLRPPPPELTRRRTLVGLRRKPTHGRIERTVAPRFAGRGEVTRRRCWLARRASHSSTPAGSEGPCRNKVVKIECLRSVSWRRLMAWPSALSNGQGDRDRSAESPLDIRTSSTRQLQSQYPSTPLHRPT